MIKIGDFSQLAHVSVKTLHHYGEIGIFLPIHVDRYSGYRYYSLDQIPTLNRILAFKDLGFSLEQIAQLLDENLSVAEMRGMLRMKQHELSDKIQDEQSRLARVQFRIRNLEQEGLFPVREITIKEIPALTALSVSAVAASEEAIWSARQSLQRLLLRQLNRARLKPINPWFAIIRDLPYEEGNLEVELAVGVNNFRGHRNGDWSLGLVKLLELPAVLKMATTIHEGEYTTISQTYSSLYSWTQSNGYQISGACREIYLRDTGINTPQVQLDSELTEVQCPVEKASIPISILSNKESKSITMEPKIITKPSLKAVGLSYIGKNEGGEIHKMWDRFKQRYHEIKTIDTTCCYGLCFSSPIDMSQQGKVNQGDFEYVAAVEVDNDQDIPQGMVYREVPAYSYVVFTHHGKLTTLGETYDYIYNTWLSQSGYTVHPDKFDMEVYTDEFIPNSDDSKFYIYVAINP